MLGIVLEDASEAAASARAEAAGSRDPALAETLARVEDELANLSALVTRVARKHIQARDLVDEASMESFPASDPPGY